MDSNEPENILFGDDGHAYLIDFQTSWGRRPNEGRWPERWWLALLQREDLYHVLEHKRPDMAPEGGGVHQTACGSGRPFSASSGSGAGGVTSQRSARS